MGPATLVVVFILILFAICGGLILGTLRGSRICPNRQCRHRNQGTARFCGKCGQRLEGPP